MYILQFDGLYHRLSGCGGPYPGIMCYGWLIWRDGKLTARGHGGYAHWQLATSNGAEYLALIAGLEALLQLDPADETVVIQGDAKMIIEQMQSRVLTHSPRVQQFRRQARRLCRNLNNIRWVWTPRRENEPADRLTRQAFEQIKTDQPDLFMIGQSPETLVEVPRGLHPLLQKVSFAENSPVFL